MKRIFYALFCSYTEIQGNVSPWNRETPKLKGPLEVIRRTLSSSYGGRRRGSEQCPASSGQLLPDPRLVSSTELGLELTSSPMSVLLLLE